jgi:AraC family transcriptional regulator of adaptative response / DNA-3-methyladenine glycosylase II
LILEPDKYELARQKRDPRFDGRFFVGVMTTGIYCRPVCPVKVPKKENVKLYPSAAAAAEAGFRPCLRCRPESSPGTPAWLGSSHTVSKALQLIELGAMDDGSVDSIADSLAIGSRQLTRLFKKHIGASPVAVAQTRRLHFAKQLIDETSLSMAEICFAAGFGSIRRFNAVFKSTYNRTPRELRQRRSNKTNSSKDISIKLHYRLPFDYQAMLQFLATRAIPGVEVVSEKSYRRTISRGGQTGEFCLEFASDEPSARLSIHFADSAQLLRIVEQVKLLFDFRADSEVTEHELSQDPFLASIVARNPGLRVPGCWDGCEVAVRAIVGQQVSVKAASTLMARLAERHGIPYQSELEENSELTRIFPDPGTLAEADLSGLGITGQRIAAIQAVAKAVDEGELLFDGSQGLEEFGQRICNIKGIGPWTAQYIALRALADPDAFPHGDLILQRAAGSVDKPLTGKQLLAKAESWRPWRAYAVMYLWQHYIHSIAA